MVYLFLFISLIAAQEKESNSDLRDVKILFEVIEDKKITQLQQNNGEFSLFRQGKTQRIAEPQAKVIDFEFSALFLKVQYELTPEAQTCQNNIQLKLRSESFVFCNKDEQRTQAIQAFLNKTNSF